MALCSPSPPPRLLYWQALFLPRVFWTTCRPSVWDRRCVHGTIEFGALRLPSMFFFLLARLVNMKCCSVLFDWRYSLSLQ